MASKKICRKTIKQKFGGLCAYCGCQLSDKFHVDHVNAVFRDGKQMQRPENHKEDNLYPACIQCNLFKATFTIEEFRQEIASQVDRARRFSVNFRTAERFGMVTVNSYPIVFWFEKFHMS